MKEETTGEVADNDDAEHESQAGEPNRENDDWQGRPYGEVAIVHYD